MTKALTVHNASINTATVAIHTLTISGRQVTLATFRQLREESLIDYDGNFLGLPWGTVNYHPGNACPIGAHEHVVWQQGDELRRGTVEPPRFGLYRPAVDLTEWVIAHGKPSDKPVYGDDAKVWWEPAEFLRNGQFRLAQFPDIDISAPPPTEIGWRYRSFAIPREVWERQPSPAVAESLAQLNSELDDETERRQRHRDRWAEVQALPQLFIAT